MHYLLLITNAPDAWDDRDAHPGDGVLENWPDYTKALHAGGALVAGAGLQPPDTATSVRLRGGERLLTDGPFVETKEHLIGFYLIDVPDLDAALDWAAKIPNVRTGTVEVLPAMAGTASGLGILADGSAPAGAAG